MATVLDRVPVDRISAEARHVRVGPTLLTIVAAVLYGLGWVTAKAFGIVWYALAWSVVAVKVGWREARQPAVGGRRGEAA